MLCQVTTVDCPIPRKGTETAASFRPSACLSKFLNNTRKAVVYDINNYYKYNKKITTTAVRNVTLILLEINRAFLPIIIKLYATTSFGYQ